MRHEKNGVAVFRISVGGHARIFCRTGNAARNYDHEVIGLDARVHHALLPRVILVALVVAHGEHGVVIRSQIERCEILPDVRRLAVEIYVGYNVLHGIRLVRHSDAARSTRARAVRSVYFAHAGVYGRHRRIGATYAERPRVTLRPRRAVGRKRHRRIRRGGGIEAGVLRRGHGIISHER